MKEHKWTEKTNKGQIANMDERKTKYIDCLSSRMLREKKREKKKLEKHWVLLMSITSQGLRKLKPSIKFQKTTKITRILLFSSVCSPIELHEITKGDYCTSGDYLGKWLNQLKHPYRRLYIQRTDNSSCKHNIKRESKWVSP